MDKVMCVMKAGAPLTQQSTDALLINAIDMWDEGRRTQEIRTRSYHGIIQSNLEVTETFGVPAVAFEAVIGTPDFRSTEVHFVIRVDDLEHMNPEEWNRIMIRLGLLPFPPPPPTDNPEWN